MTKLKCINNPPCLKGLCCINIVLMTCKHPICLKYGAKFCINCQRSYLIYHPYFGKYDPQDVIKKTTGCLKRIEMASSIRDKVFIILTLYSFVLYNFNFFLNNKSQYEIILIKAKEISEDEYFQDKFNPFINYVYVLEKFKPT